MAYQFFITGIGTGIGKTLTAALLAKALEADYWKPVQAGQENGTDSEWIRSRLSNTVVHPEVYNLRLAASPHIAAREEGVNISIEKICRQMPANNRNLIIEGPGGLMVPLNELHFVADLILALNVKVILVSRNYLGSINHSLLTAAVCKQKHLPVAGWIFNDQFFDYEEEIVSWSGFPRIASVPFAEDITDKFINTQADYIREQIAGYL